MQITQANASNQVLNCHDQLTQHAVEQLIRIGQQAIHSRGVFHIALAGGSTPKQIYQALAQHSKHSLHWSRTHIFWSDERYVPSTHPESNYHMAMENGIEQLPIPQENIHRIATELPPPICAHNYHTLIQSTVSHQTFDLILLGIGTDGHTASLFPNTQALEETSQLVVENYIPQLQAWRITFTYPLLQKARHKHFYVTGSSKQQILQQILQQQNYPATHIGTPQSPALWFLGKDLVLDFFRNML